MSQFHATMCKYVYYAHDDDDDDSSYFYGYFNQYPHGDMSRPFLTDSFRGNVGIFLLSLLFLCSFFLLCFGIFSLWRCRQRCGSLQYLRGSNLQSNRTATVVTWTPA